MSKPYVDDEPVQESNLSGFIIKVNLEHYGKYFILHLSMIPCSTPTNSPPADSQFKEFNLLLSIIPNSKVYKNRRIQKPKTFSQCYQKQC